MKKQAFIGVFRTFPSGEWRVVFPDIPGCVVTAKDLDTALIDARQSLARHLALLGNFAPKARSYAEISEAAQGDWMLRRSFDDAIFFLVEPSEPEAGFGDWPTDYGDSDFADPIATRSLSTGSRSVSRG